MSALLLLAVGLPADAKKPKPDPAPDPAALIATQEQAACSPETPEGFQIHTGFATASDPAEAIDEARLAARKLAIETSCAGKSEARCAVIRRHVEAWKDPFHNPLTQRACAHVGIRRVWLDDDTRDQARMAKDLALLGARVAAVLPEGGQLWIDPPVWGATGCHAGEVGASLSVELRNGLAAAGGVRLATQRSGANVLRVALSPSGNQLVLAAEVSHPGQTGREPIEGIRFPADLFDLGEGGGDCRFDQDLGLEGGRRVGADGRVVGIAVPGEGSYCAGDDVAPSLVVDRSSRVRVFSVARSGLAYQVWPAPGQDDIVDGSLSLGTMQLLPTPDGGDEKLVAVAVSEGSDFGTMKDWKGFCRIELFNQALYPKGAAVGAATFRVHPFDADACLVRGVARTAPQAFPPAPTCGE